jgi:hypothetical protein
MSYEECAQDSGVETVPSDDRAEDDVKMDIGEIDRKDGVADIMFSIRCLEPSVSACRLFVCH